MSIQATKFKLNGYLGGNYSSKISLPEPKDTLSKAIPSEIVIEILKYSICISPLEDTLKNEQNLLLVCKSWYHYIHNPSIQAVKKKQLIKKQEKELIKNMVAFGPRDWEKYCGDVGEVPELTDEIATILLEKYNYFPGKVQEHCLLTFIPEKVNEQPLTRQLIREIIKNPKNGNRFTQFNLYNPHSLFEPNRSPSQSKVQNAHWVLMGTKGIPHNHHTTQITSKVLQEGDTTLDATDAIISIFMHYIKTGKRLFSNEYILCQQTGEQAQEVVVGGFSLQGLNIVHKETSRTACSQIFSRTFYGSSAP
jgi:hypothetical protein